MPYSDLQSINSTKITVTVMFYINGYKSWHSFHQKQLFYFPLAPKFFYRQIAGYQSESGVGNYRVSQSWTNKLLRNLNWGAFKHAPDGL